jgi:hypothetical protein
MTDVTAGPVVVDNPLGARATQPPRPVFLSRTGRRGRMLALVGHLAAVIAVLWVVALVAGAFGVATPGVLHFPGPHAGARDPGAPTRSGRIPRSDSVGQPAATVRAQPAGAGRVVRAHDAAPAPAGAPPRPAGDASRGSARSLGSSRSPAISLPHASSGAAKTGVSQQHTSSTTSTVRPTDPATTPRRSSTQGSSVRSTAHSANGNEGGAGSAVRATTPAGTGSTPTPAGSSPTVPSGAVRGHSG